MSRHRADVRPRWGRIGLLGAAAVVTLVAVLAGFGLLSGSSNDPAVATDPIDAAAAFGQAVTATTPTTPTGTPTGTPSASGSATAGAPASGVPASRTPTGIASSTSADTRSVASSTDTALPAGSGSGRRAVFSQTEQRVWIVNADNEVERTYLASGSAEDNLLPGTYHVYGKSRWAVGIDDSGVMQYFVRFAHGTDNGASIGFHSIPTKHGTPLQTVAQLGQRLSHGCIRQKTDDAIAMWDFADVGTEVVVVA